MTFQKVKYQILRVVRLRPVSYSHPFRRILLINDFESLFFDEINPRRFENRMRLIFTAFDFINCLELERS